MNWETWNVNDAKLKSYFIDAFVCLDGNSQGSWHGLFLFSPCQVQLRVLIIIILFETRCANISHRANTVMFIVHLDSPSKWGRQQIYNIKNGSPILTMENKQNEIITTRWIIIMGMYDQKPSNTFHCIFGNFKKAMGGFFHIKYSTYDFIIRRIAPKEILSEMWLAINSFVFEQTLIHFWNYQVQLQTLIHGHSLHNPPSTIHTSSYSQNNRWQ